MVERSNLAKKFTLLLSLVFIGAILLSGFALSKALEHKAQAEISARGQILLQIVNSVRTYTDTHVTTLLTSDADTQSQFRAESIPSFAAREVFELFRQDQEYKNFYYKDAVLNPTNLRDKVDDFEVNLVERFRTEPELQELSGFRSLFGEQLFYSARPLMITESSCLRCHSTPEAAPKNHLDQYGAEQGFGWTLNDILGTQIVYLPARKVFAAAHQAFSLFIGIFIGVFVLVTLLINQLLKQNVIQPLQPIVQIADKISHHSLNDRDADAPEFKSLASLVKRTDEIGLLGRVFQRMVQEVLEREFNLRHQIQTLYIEVDQAKRANQVANITETEHFQQLRQEAKDIRKQWNGD